MTNQTDNCFEELDYSQETVASLANLAQYYEGARLELDRRLNDFAKENNIDDEPQDKAIKADGYVANTGMKTAAQRAIDWREQGHKGGTQIGATRARQIVSGEKMSADTVKRMFSFFSRHEVDKKATGFNSGEDGYPSPGRVAWDLWGGDAGFSWSRNIVDSLDVE